MRHRGEALLRMTAAIVFWLLVWQLLSFLIGSELLLPSPWAVVRSFCGLAQTTEFYRSILHTLLRVAAGFAAGMAAGLLAGTLTAFSRAADVLLTPLKNIIKATPVTSFIVLILLYFSSNVTPSAVAFLAVLPIALQMGFEPNQAGAIGIIGGADGPTAIFLSSKLAPNLMGAIAVSAYSYMALVPIIQPPFMRLLTTKKERLIRMKPPRAVSSTEKIIFPIVGLLLTCFLVPSGLPLLGMLFFGNLLKESGVTRRLAETARGPLIDTITILLGITVGASTQATQFLTLNSIKIFGLGALSFVIATCAGVLFVKLFNLILKDGNKINPLIGNAGVSAVPDSARISQVVGLEYDPTNYLLMHAMGPNVAGVIGSAVAAGILLGFLG